MAIEQPEVANRTDPDSQRYFSPLLARQGAAEAQDNPVQPGRNGVAWHYGSPLVEQRNFESGTALVDRSNRRVIQIEGSDAPAFLNNLVSQKLDNAPDGFSAAALDLDAQGRILHTMEITRVGDTFYVDTSAEEFPTLIDYLGKMVFWSEVTVAEADLAILTLSGELIDASPAAPIYQRRVNWAGPARLDLAVPRAGLDAAVDKLLDAGATLTGLMAYTAERVKAVEPELGTDLDAKTIPHEVPRWIGHGDNLGAVHLDKGCYRGQETVARVENLGRSPRVLVLLHLDGSAPSTPVPGTEITAGTRTVGRLGTVVDDCDFGPIALALIKRSALDSALSITDVSVNVDKDSLPVEGSEQRGRMAVNKLRGRE